ncbi:MAG: hydrogenase nickel incorporation protein HypB [Anaerolineae bacterium]|nr:hydrogenase nickel incorporation protein HypB [Anaerolineae bacterium]
MSRIDVMKDILQANIDVADQIRARFAYDRTLALNLIASPGAGKTSLLERTVATLKDEFTIGVVEGDLVTSLDADRIARHGVPAVQINTTSGCHLEAHQVQGALAQLPDTPFDLVLIENVGNLVCPTGFDLGEDAKVVIVSLTEGDDKPLKYPGAFTVATAAVINKIDLAPYLPASAAILRKNALSTNPNLVVFETSCTTGAGIDAWLDWVRAGCAAKKAARPDA